MDARLPLVYVIGDSISIQYGPHLKKFLSGFWRYARKEGEAEALLNLDRPQGANGGDTSMVLPFLQAVFARDDFRPDILLLNCGLHDIKTDPATGRIQVPLTDYERNLREIVRLAAGSKISLAWVQTTHTEDGIHNAEPNKGFFRHARDGAAYDETARRVMGAGGVPVIPLGDFTRNLGPDSELFCDHAHFHEAVREKQAAFIAGWLLAWKDRRKRD